MMKIREEIDLRDYRDVRMMMISETLEDGETDSMDLYVALTSHAYKRMNEEVSRDCEWEQVENLIIDCGSQLFDVKLGEDILLINDSMTLAITGKLHAEKGKMIFIVFSIIHKILRTGDKIIEKKVYINEERNTKVIRA